MRWLADSYSRCGADSAPRHNHTYSHNKPQVWTSTSTASAGFLGSGVSLALSKAISGNIEMTTASTSSYAIASRAWLTDRPQKQQHFDFGPAKCQVWRKWTYLVLDTNAFSALSWIDEESHVVTHGIFLPPCCPRQDFALNPEQEGARPVPET
eukprot:scaffold10947_cov123-Isochrysis_galbana.AAC.4